MLQERPDHPGHIQQPLEHKTLPQSIPDQKEENIFGTGRQTW